MELTPEQLAKMKEDRCEQCGQPLGGLGDPDCPVIHKYDFYKYQHTFNDRLATLEAENRKLRKRVDILADVGLTARTVSLEEIEILKGEDDN